MRHFYRRSQATLPNARASLAVLFRMHLPRPPGDLFQFYIPIYGHEIGLSASAIGSVPGIRLTTTNAVRAFGPMIFGAIGTAFGVPAVFWIDGALMAAQGYWTNRTTEKKAGALKARAPAGVALPLWDGVAHWLTGGGGAIQPRSNLASLMPAPRQTVCPAVRYRGERKQRAAHRFGARDAQAQCASSLRSRTDFPFTTDTYVEIKSGTGRAVYNTVYNDKPPCPCPTVSTSRACAKLTKRAGLPRRP